MQNQYNTCSSKCCGCIEMRIGIVLIALFGIAWSIYETILFSLAPPSDVLQAEVIIVMICAMLLGIGSIGALLGVYASKPTPIFAYIIICGMWAIVWIFLVIVTLNIYVSWQIACWIYFTYIVRKYYYTLKNGDNHNNNNQKQQQPLIHQQPPQQQYVPANPFQKAQYQPHGHGQQPPPPYQYNQAYHGHNQYQAHPPPYQPQPQPIPQQHITYIIQNGQDNDNCWSCPNCTFQQPKSNDACQLCNAPQPNQLNSNDNGNPNAHQAISIPEPEPMPKDQHLEIELQDTPIDIPRDTWSCPMCTYSQLNTNNECEICGHKRNEKKETAYIPH